MISTVSKLKVGVLSTYHKNYVPMTEMTFPSFERYCLHNEYSFLPHVIDIEDTPHALTRIGFSKIDRVLSVLLEDEYDVLWVTDVDILITNQAVKIEQFLDDDNNYYVARDWDGINNGSFIIKNNEWSIEFLKWILSHRHSCRNEQDIIKHNTKSPFWKKIKILPQPSINSFLYSEYPKYGQSRIRNIGSAGDWKPEHLMFHLPGFSYAQRIEILNKTEFSKYK